MAAIGDAGVSVNTGASVIESGPAPVACQYEEYGCNRLATIPSVAGGELVFDTFPASPVADSVP